MSMNTCSCCPSSSAFMSASHWILAMFGSIIQISCNIYLKPSIIFIEYGFLVP